MSVNQRELAHHGQADKQTNVQKRHERELLARQLKKFPLFKPHSLGHTRTFACLVIYDQCNSDDGNGITV